METLTVMSPHLRRFTAPSPLRSLFRRSISMKAQLSTDSSRKSGAKQFPIAGMEEAFMGFITGRKKATEVAHSVWKNIIQKGDTVIDATCGNGYDTLALLTMVADESGRGCVYGMDIQQEALDNTSALLEISVEENKRKLVKLLKLCHSKMEDIVQNDNSVRDFGRTHFGSATQERLKLLDFAANWNSGRLPLVHDQFSYNLELVVFNLGYLPGGDKAILTMPGTTLAALQAAGRVLGSGGLISVMIYVGHPGGRDELESIQGFASGLPVESWASFKLEMLNRPTGPVLILIFKK